MSSPTTEHRPTFDIEPATLLENLKRGLGLKSDWKRLGKCDSLTTYRHGNYRMSICTGYQTKKIQQVMVEIVENSQAALESMVELLNHVIKQVDRELSQEEASAIEEIFPQTSESPFFNQKIVNGIQYRCLRENQELFVSINKPFDDETNEAADELLRS